MRKRKDFVQDYRDALSRLIRNEGTVVTGNYKIEIYHNGFKIGEGIRSLKKGGLFG